MSVIEQSDVTPSRDVSTVNHVNVFRYMPGGQFPNGGATTYVAPTSDEHTSEEETT